MKRLLLIAAIIVTAGVRHASAADISIQPSAPKGQDSNMHRLSDAQAAQKAQSKLTDEQRKKLQDASQTLRKEQTAIYEKLRVARHELEQAAQSEQFDEQAIRAKAAVVGQLEGDLAIVRANITRSSVPSCRSRPVP